MNCDGRCGLGTITSISLDKGIGGMGYENDGDLTTMSYWRGVGGVVFLFLFILVFSYFILLSLLLFLHR